ncbi:hypothetical protein OJF2_13720 [Aquisphaera giovannonii]|uniref:Uncharacterized protein n=1 Tax=Aquisphaera giovannonii TaxID=406548 RepID=A0A5B9VY22_9BACT|nr:hypothetical protein [Aquisphaera giovannonii]QEH32887.1 hypothetical protein OJF2_13720 [Aquisphaera giovannonii]
MRPFLRGLLGFGCLLASSSLGYGQVVDYPPADGQMTFVPPIFPAAGAVGAHSVETFPAFAGVYEVLPREAQPLASTEAPAARARAKVRGRQARVARNYARGYSQGPAPYDMQLPMGQLPGQGGVPTIDYAPSSRFQTFGQGYDVSPYGSNFFGGYFRGFPLAW